MPRSRPGRGGRRLAIVLVLGLAGCATRAPVPQAAVPIAPDRAVALVQQWDADWRAFRGMRGAIDLTVKNRRGSERMAALLLVAPTALRLEVTTPFGLPALVATAGPDDITIFHVLERRAQVTQPSPAAVERWLGVALAPTMLIHLLIGTVPAPADAQAVTVESAPSPHLAWTEDGVQHRVWVMSEGRPVRLLLGAPGGASALTADFEWSREGGLSAVRLDAPQRGAEVTVRYLSVEYGESSPEAFHLVLPPDVPVERLD